MIADVKTAVVGKLNVVMRTGNFLSKELSIMIVLLKRCLGVDDSG